MTETYDTSSGATTPESRAAGRSAPYDTIIVGSGPAGCTAALYAGRADLKTLVVAGYESGGQLMLTSDVENYPGYPEGVQGPDMMQDFRKQAERFGAEFVDEDAVKVDLDERPFTVKTDTKEFQGETLIIASGSEAKWLGLESEKRLQGKGVSACATCDGFFFKDKEVVVVGGGDSAMEESTFLTKFCKKVTIVHRRDSFRASKIMAKRALEHDKIDVIWNAEVIEVLGEDGVTGVKIAQHPEGAPTKHLDDDGKPTDDDVEIFDFDCEGLFLAIGHVPNTDLFKGDLKTDEAGYLVAEGSHDTYTNIEGVFIAGDVQDHRYRQAVTAAGSGCKAAIDCERWLEAQGQKEASLPEEELKAEA